MPCTYIESDDEIAERRNADKRRITQPYVDKLNKLTRMLCWVSPLIHPAVIVATIDSPEKRDFLAWKKQHDAEDAARNQEEIKQKALAKLSPAERKVLGL
jgi:hypothetical protein